MTIGGLKYGPYLGAPAPSVWANLSYGGGGPTFLPEYFPYFAWQQAQNAIDYYQQSVVTSLPAVGPGDDSVPVLPVNAEWPSEEVCWRNPESGDIKCWTAGSIFEPGGTWGPDGSWFRIPDVGFHEVIDPDLLPGARVFEDPITPTPEVGEVPLHAEDGWISGIIGLGLDYFGGGVPGAVASFAPPSPGVPPPIQNGAAMSYAGSCPPRKTRTLTIDCATGQEVKRTRRRRRRLLTSSDLGDLAQLQALVGKGSNAMSVAVSKAIR